MPLAVQELHSQGLEFPVLLGGAAINRKFALRALYPDGKDVRRPVRPGRLLLQGRLRGPGRDGPADRARAAAPSSSRRSAPPATRLREVGEEEEVLDTTDDTVRSAVRTDVEIPEPPFWGVREIEVDREELYTHLDTHVLFKLHWGGRGVKGEEWRKLLEEDFRPRLERMWAERRLPASARAAGLLPVLLRGQRHRRARPGGPRDGDRALHLPAPAQGRPPLPGRLLPPEGLRRARRRRRCRPSPSAPR